MTCLRRPLRPSPRQRLCPLLLLCLCALATAAPFTPSSDTQVLTTVPARASDPAARELVALRRAWRQQPNDLPTALRLAERSFAQVAAEGDPRYVGQAQAVLQPWWALPAPPLAVRVLRAQLLQFDHHFDAALADLDAALAAQPDNGTAWSWRTAILMVQADYGRARQSCKRLAPLATPLIGAACLAQVDAVTGHAAAAADRLRAALAAHPRADAAERLWSLTRLAENEERRGAHPQAEAAFRAALALGLPDVYLQAAYADFLLDRGRPADVLTLLADGARADVLLLRLALAAQAAGTRDATRWRDALAARFDAARQRGDTSHRKEESRFVLAFNGVTGDTGDTARALQLAQQNFAEQREPADARILLEAALAARQPAAARPVLDWLAANRVESVVLHRLAAKLKAQQ